MTEQQLQDNRIRIGQRLAQLRQEKRLTQAQLADLAGMKQHHVSRLEQGLFDFRIESLLRLLYALDHKLDFAEISLTEKTLEQKSLRE